MINLIHLDGDEVDTKFKMEFDDEDLAKFKYGAEYSGKFIIHEAYLKALINKIKICEADFETYRIDAFIKFEQGKYYRVAHDDKLFIPTALQFFIDKLIMCNKIGVGFYKKDDNLYLDAETFNP